MRCCKGQLSPAAGLTTHVCKQPVFLFLEHPEIIWSSSSKLPPRQCQQPLHVPTPLNPFFSGCTVQSITEHL